MLFGLKYTPKSIFAAIPNAHADFATNWQSKLLDYEGSIPELCTVHTGVLTVHTRILTVLTGIMNGS
jgi:hypothetical protein